MCKDSMFCDLEFKQTVPAAFLNLSVTKARANDTVIVEPDVDSICVVAGRRENAAQKGPFSC